MLRLLTQHPLYVNNYGYPPSPNYISNPVESTILYVPSEAARHVSGLRNPIAKYH